MKKLICLMLAISIVTSGCSTLVSSTQTVNVTCSESDATIQINGGQPYQGKAQIEARKNKPVSIVCFKQGYFPSQKVVSSSLSGAGIADLIGSFILVFPAFGLFTPGAWKLDETDVTLVMVKQ
jgi:uncharacterized protein YceK